jgi:hypothetical protein
MDERGLVAREGFRMLDGLGRFRKGVEDRGLPSSCLLIARIAAYPTNELFGESKLESGSNDSVEVVAKELSGTGGVVAFCGV